MTKLPERPNVSHLRQLDPELFTLRAGSPLSRIYFRGGDHPTHWRDFRHFGPLKSGRFDHHPSIHGGPGKLYRRFGVMYCAQANDSDIAGLDVCLAEVYQEPRTVQRSNGIPAWAVFYLTDHLTLLDLRGKWPTLAGASQALSAGRKSSTRNWARAFYRVYPKIDGLLYRSSMCGGANTVALNERAARAIPHAPGIHHDLADHKITAVLKKAAASIGYTVMP